uniref:Alpha 1,4-glycosyltransferase domain-containing protein n=1 Tax=Biomphalaria glabrata TaxID=6526 RepID=A0A2C9LMV0_BIOGL
MAFRKACLHYKSRKNIFNLLVFLLSCTVSWYALCFAFDVVVKALDTGAEDNIIMFKDIYTHEPWPGLESNLTEPGAIPAKVHYYWCGNKMFRFVDYLSLLSIVRILKPQKIIFHHFYQPLVDTFWYHTWFQELKQSVPNLVLRRSISNLDCGSEEVLKYILNKLSQEGGVYVGEKVILTQVPSASYTDDFFYSFRFRNKLVDLTSGVIFSKNGFPVESIGEKLKFIYQSPRTCYIVDEFDAIPESRLPDPERACLVADSLMYPKNIWDNTTRFSELARWLYYGQRARLFPVENSDELIPMVSHLIWMRTNNLIKSDELEFYHYLSIMSALYVAGFKVVYIHGEIEPYGPWWELLKRENVKFILIERPETIFQQAVDGPSHQSDVLRLNILLRYGGVYQDRDVLWVGQIPDNLRRYPVVACPDWPQNGEWPEVFNMGVMMAKRNAPWLKSFLSTFRYYRDDKWAFNAVMMPYKAYEQHPDQLYVDRYLQVICFYGVCHPTWQPDYKRDIMDQRPVPAFAWREARSFHFTVPKPPESLTSPAAVKNGDDIYAEIGKLILEKSGHLDLL